MIWAGAAVVLSFNSKFVGVADAAAYGCIPRGGGWADAGGLIGLLSRYVKRAGGIVWAPCAGGRIDDLIEILRTFAFLSGNIPVRVLRA